MPYITVQADTQAESQEAVMLCERINLSDLESQHVCAQLVERLQWAMRDAHNHERAVDHAPTDGTGTGAGQPVLDRFSARVLTTAS